MNRYKATCIDSFFDKDDDLRNLEVFTSGDDESEVSIKLSKELSGTGIEIVSIEKLPPQKDIFADSFEKLLLFIKTLIKQ